MSILIRLITSKTLTGYFPQNKNIDIKQNSVITLQLFLFIY